MVDELLLDPFISTPNDQLFLALAIKTERWSSA
jgi:hypothetical protein